ncbi:GNAT family N-acetyltransferase [Alteribacter aurantiacus]|uniref:GNAT family N-acetyltransferase n=1 Tax=Alteribacter aurantiacus TaxID=254410 RepID=UPI00040C0CD6|nr:GNAT family N-acetyltransferase [Alteribacter aurantiacus]
MVTYRHYQSGDEQALIDLWNECLPQDPIHMKRFRNTVLLDANFDPEGLRIASDEGQLVGCVYAIRRLLPMTGADLEPDNGWITFFFVKPGYRQKEVATRLFDEAEDFLKNAGRSTIFFASYAPNYILPGIDEKAYPRGYAFLQKRGYKRQYSPVAMDKSLVGYEKPKVIDELKMTRESEGYTFTRAREKDLYEAISFANEKFNPDWGRAIREGVLHGIPMERIFVARHFDRVVGFCMYGAYDGVIERFGPFGVDETEQGKGLGKILLHECLQVMKSEGAHGAWFLWTSETSSAGYLYKKSGFHVSRTFHVMKREI